MTDSRDFVQEREGVRDRLFDILFHRAKGTTEEVYRLFRRLGILTSILARRT
jgi:hypothetical protein